MNMQAGTKEAKRQYNWKPKEKREIHKQESPQMQNIGDNKQNCKYSK